MHINRTIEKIKNRRSKPKPIKNNKAIPIFLYPVEAVIYKESDTVNLKKNILAGTPERAKYEMETLLEKNNVFDYEISVTMPQGQPVNMIAEDAGRSIHGSFAPFIKADERKAKRGADRDKILARQAAQMDKRLMGDEKADLQKKLRNYHNKV